MILLVLSLLAVLFMLNNCGCNTTPVNPTVQSFDQEIEPQGTRVIARADDGKWRFMVASTHLVLVTIRQRSTLGNLQPKYRYIAPNSAIELQGSSSVEIVCTNLDPVDNAKIETFNAGYLCGGLEPVEYSEDGQTTPTFSNWGDVGTNGGYAQPFTNAFRLYVADQVRVRATDPNGLVVFQSGTQPADERLFIDFDAPQNLKFEIRENGSTATGVDFHVTWYRK